MKLLVIEDEIRLADILSDWFQKKGFEVTICHDGLSGYEKAQNENFDVILSDVMLPGLDGFQLVRKLREKKIATPVLFLTARVELPREIFPGGQDKKRYIKTCKGKLFLCMFLSLKQNPSRLQKQNQHHHRCGVRWRYLRSVG